jgi:hypothetical protein
VFSPLSSTNKTDHHDITEIVESVNKHHKLVGKVGGGMVFNTTFNNISVISWLSVLLVEDNGLKPLTCRKSLTNKLILPYK